MPELFIRLESGIRSSQFKDLGGMYDISLKLNLHIEDIVKRRKNVWLWYQDLSKL